MTRMDLDEATTRGAEVRQLRATIATLRNALKGSRDVLQLLAVSHGGAILRRQLARANEALDQAGGK